MKSLLLNNQKADKEIARGGMEKMKGICICLLGVGLFLLMAAMPAFATGPTTTQTSKVTIETFYNPYGVALSSTQQIHTVTTTTSTSVVNTKTVTSTSTTTNDQTITSSWRAGSLKVDKITGTSHTGNSTDTKSDGDGAYSDTTYTINYSYNENGQLVKVTGSSDTVGDKGTGKNSDGTDGHLGTYQSHTEDTYVIKNGQALKTSSTTTGSNYDKDSKVDGGKVTGGNKTANFTSTTTYNYDLYAGGQWLLTSETTVSVSQNTDKDGNIPSQTDYKGLSNLGWEVTTRTTTYNRDAKTGLITGMTVTMSGERFEANGQSGETTSGQYSHITEYTATVSFDKTQGWYISKDVTVWDTFTPDAPKAASANTDWNDRDKGK